MASTSVYGTYYYYSPAYVSDTEGTANGSIAQWVNAIDGSAPPYALFIYPNLAVYRMLCIEPYNSPLFGSRLVYECNAYAYSGRYVGSSTKGISFCRSWSPVTTAVDEFAGYTYSGNVSSLYKNMYTFKPNGEATQYFRIMPYIRIRSSSLYTETGKDNTLTIGYCIDARTLDPEKKGFFFLHNNAPILSMNFTGTPSAITRGLGQLYLWRHATGVWVLSASSILNLNTGSVIHWVGPQASYWYPQNGDTFTAFFPSGIEQAGWASSISMTGTFSENILQGMRFIGSFNTYGAFLSETGTQSQIYV
jgi:hypothetical protein